MRAAKLADLRVRGLELPAKLRDLRRRTLLALARRVRPPLQKARLRLVRRGALLVRAHLARQLGDAALGVDLLVGGGFELLPEQRHLLHLPCRLRLPDLHRLLDVVELSRRRLGTGLSCSPRPVHLPELVVGRWEVAALEKATQRVDFHAQHVSLPLFCNAHLRERAVLGLFILYCALELNLALELVLVLVLDQAQLLLQRTHARLGVGRAERRRGRRGLQHFCFGCPHSTRQKGPLKNERRRTLQTRLSS